MGIFNNFTKFTGKHLCQNLFLIKLQASAYDFIKKDILAQVFSCKCCEFFKNTFFIEHHRWLLLSMHCIISHSNTQNSTIIHSRKYGHWQCLFRITACFFCYWMLTVVKEKTASKKTWPDRSSRS